MKLLELIIYTWIHPLVKQLIQHFKLLKNKKCSLCLKLKLQFITHHTEIVAKSLLSMDAYCLEENS